MASLSICTTCGFQGKPKTRTKGSIWIEIVLWICMILPGVIYSIWRLTTREQVCPKCGNPTMIPLDTPQGAKLAAKFAK
jgi:ribosomal protein L37E